MPEQPALDDLRPKLQPIVLVILDGWGLSASVSGNAIRQANPSNFIRLWHEHPHGVLRAVSAIDEAAHLRGSSETGHASIGTGRLLHSDVSDLSLAIHSGTFFRAPGFTQLVATTQASHAALHVIGLVSDTSSHGRTEQLLACLELARQQQLGDVIVHLILDTGSAESARQQLDLVQYALASRSLGRIGSVSGRTSALDRGKVWERTRATYRALIGRQAPTATVADILSRLRGDDQAADFEPTTVVNEAGQPVGPIRAGDTVLLTTTRPDRSMQLVRAFTDHQTFAWLGLLRAEPFLGVTCWTLTDFHTDLPDVHPVFQTAEIPDSLGRIIADHGLRQLKCSTTDRATHVGYYLNGGRAEPVDHEQRVVVPGHGQTQSDLAIDCHAIEQQILPAIADKAADLIVVNLSAADQAAHTGDFALTVSAVGSIDTTLGRISEATMEAGGALIVVADHGNAESLLPSRAGHHHTRNGVPWIVATRQNRRATRVAPSRLAFPAGLPDHRHTLADVAPTILGLLGIAKPSTMTGRNLLE